MMHRRNTEGLKVHAQDKHDQAFKRVEAGIRQLIKEGRPINFKTVKEVSGVSRAWLYNQPEIRQRIEQLRSQVQPRKLIPHEQRASQASNAAKVKTLLQEVKNLRAEKEGLRQHLEEAYGRTLYADEQAELYKRESEALKAENAELKQQLNQYRSQSPGTESSTAINASLKSTIAPRSKVGRIQSEITSLGIKLNSTLDKLIKSAPEDVLLAALDALREAMEEGEVKNPAGWFNCAVQARWKPNGDHTAANRTSNLKLFNEWFSLARSRGIVIASTQSNGDILVLTAEEKWFPFCQILALYPLESLK